MYSTVQDLVTHADKLWQTLDSDKVHQEIKNERACHQHQSDQHDQPGQSDQSGQPNQSEQYSNQAERKSQDSQSTANLSQQSQWDCQDDCQNKQLSAEKHQYQINNNFCFNCDHSDH